MADVLKLNEEELPVVLQLTGGLNVQDIIDKYGIRYVVHTCGASFSEVFSARGLESHIPTPGGDVVDTIGAGDSFTAAFVTALLGGCDVRTCHRKAVEVAAYVCACEGAINPLPASISI